MLVTYLGLKHGVNPDVPAASPGNYTTQPSAGAIPARS